MTYNATAIWVDGLPSSWQVTAESREEAAEDVRRTVAASYRKVFKAFLCPVGTFEIEEFNAVPDFTLGIVPASRPALHAEKTILRAFSDRAQASATWMQTRGGIADMDPIKMTLKLRGEGFNVVDCR